MFAPHPDDETLGCGGVALKKIAAGATVRFVFVTDGAASHRGVSQEALREQRKREAVEAVARLGGQPEDVVFLDIPDGQAARHVEAIATAVAPLLEEIAPESVFVPHRLDPPADHRAVRAGVLRALLRRSRPVILYEYPVWYWYGWPWIGLGGDLPDMRRTALCQTFRSVIGLGALGALNRRAFVGDVLPRKRAALAAHASQMQRSEDAAEWPVLGDLAQGAFLERLTGRHEMFARSTING